MTARTTFADLTLRFQQYVGLLPPQKRALPNIQSISLHSSSESGKEMKLFVRILCTLVLLSFDPIYIEVPLNAQGSDLPVQPAEAQSPVSPIKPAFPISIASSGGASSLFKMISNGMIEKNGHVTGSTVTSMNSFIGAPCGGVFVVLRAQNGDELGVFKMSAVNGMTMPFCVHGVLTSPHDPSVRRDFWNGEIPVEIIDNAVFAELRHTCLSNCN